MLPESLALGRVKTYNITAIQTPILTYRRNLHSRLNNALSALYCACGFTP